VWPPPPPFFGPADSDLAFADSGIANAIESNEMPLNNNALRVINVAIIKLLYIFLAG
jgi:hypothetical protein